MSVYMASPPQVKTTNTMRTLLVLGSALGALGVAPQCRTFEQIYGFDGNGGKNLCEKMWDDAFVYVDDRQSPAYTMYWFERGNPNDQVTKDILADTDNTHRDRLYGVDPATGHTDRCLDFFHKDKPSPEPGLSECQAWSDRSCCKKNTVKNDTVLKEAYGKEYHWDRCGPLSAQCHAFFVYEACFYECEPAVELFRKYPKHEDAKDHPRYYHKDEHADESSKEWQVYKMPIKASFCDRWYEACRNDMFCASDAGSYFSCAAEYKVLDAMVEDDGLEAGWIVLIVVLAVVAVAALAFGVFLVVREKKGKPVYYTPVAQSEPGEPAHLPQEMKQT